MPSPPATARIAVLSEDFLSTTTDYQLKDWAAMARPDIVAVPGDGLPPSLVTRLQPHLSPDTPMLVPESKRSAKGWQDHLAVAVFLASSLSTLRESEPPPQWNDATTYVLSDILDLSVDTTNLRTQLLGRAPYIDAIRDGPVQRPVVHLSTGLPVGYRHTWDGRRMVGVGQRDKASPPAVVHVDCRADGRVLIDEMSHDRFGLRAVRGIGERTAARLRERGVGTRSALLEASATRLESIEGLGSARVSKLRSSVIALERGTVERMGRTTLPSDTPIFIDIETDGLHPTCTWLIGALDRARDPKCRTFLQTDPGATGHAIDAFMQWLTERDAHRPVVAYNGHAFDFSVLEEHIREACPGHLDAWANRPLFDPYRMAIEGENAALPSRTNRLDDVAAALGESHPRGALDGAAVARTYRRWMESPSPETEPDWERLCAYVRADVRSLATVWDAIASSGRVQSAATTGAASPTASRQGDLSEW